MARAIKFLYALWALAPVALGATIGVSYGWETHGLVGAVVVGVIGGFVGAIAASLPALVLQVFR